MARRKPAEAPASAPKVEESKPGPASDETPEITRFVWHAADLIQKYDKISGQIETLEKQILEANRISRTSVEQVRSLTKNGVKVEVSADFERERKKIGLLIDDQIGRAERLQWQFWAYCCGAGASGAVIGGFAVMAILIFS